MKTTMPFVASATILGLFISAGPSATSPAAAAVVEGPAPTAVAAAPAPVVRTEETVAAAQEAAARQGFRVEITSARSEESTTYANPDNTFTTEVSSGPVRVKDSAAPNGWAPLDLSLHREKGGGIAAARHPQRLRLTGARGATASADLASLQAGAGRSVSMGWTGKLPQPELTGADAIYRSVRPGIDLVVRATATGFEQFVILHRRPTGDKPFSVSLPLRAKGLTAAGKPDGGIALTDAQGHVRGLIPAPTAWDATRDPRAGQSTNTAAVAMSLEHGAIKLTPDAAWLADPATRYPVTIDPSTSIKPTTDTWVETDYSSAQAGSTELRVGTYDGGSSKARSFISFNTASFAGKSVTSATLQMYQFHSWSCAAKSYQVWETGSFTNSTTWSNQPSWTKQYASVSSARGYSSGCAAGVDRIGVTPLVQSWAALGGAVRALGLRAGSETDSTYWKKFNSANAASHQPVLAVTYNSYPNVAGTPTHAPGTSSGTTTTGWTTTATPTLKATVSDPDGGSVKALFDVFNGRTLVVNHLAGSVVSSGGTSTAVVPAGMLVDGTQYIVRAYGNDGKLTSAAWSTGYDRVTVDTSKPTAPSITSATFPAGRWTGPAGLGADGKMHFTAQATSPDALTVKWSLDATTYDTSATVTGAAPAVDIALAPPARGPHTLYVQTVDNAGNVGASASYTVFYGDGPLAEPPAVSASPVDAPAVKTPVDLLMSAQPTLSADVGPHPGSTIDYDFELWDGPQAHLIATTSVTAVADGTRATWALTAGTIRTDSDYTYRVRGRNDATAGPWSSWRRLVDDRPKTPTALLASATDTERPILSAVATRPSNRAVTLRFFLWTSAGAQLGAAPLGSVDAVSGARTAVQIPTGLARTGDALKFTAAACVGDVCSAQSPALDFTLLAASSPPTVRSTVAAGDWASAQVDTGDCDGGSCPLRTTDVAVTDSDTPTVAFARFPGLAALPAGVQITAAHLQFGAPACVGACTGASLDVFPIMTAWPDAPTGEQLYGAALTDDGVAVPVTGTDLDVTDLVDQWADDSALNGGLAIAAEPGSGVSVRYPAAPSLVVDYVPAGAPSAPTHVTARAGDGGVLVDWSPGQYGGTDPEATSYTVVVTNTATGASDSSTATAGPAIVHGLTNGSPYTVAVTESSAGATSPASAPAGFTPAAVAEAQQYADAVTQFHRVTDASAAATGDPGAPLSGLSRRPAIAATALARSASQWQADDSLRRHDLTVDGDLWTASDTLVSAGADDAVVVRATGQTVAQSDDTMGTTTAEDFTFAAGAIATVVDATSADLDPSVESGTVSDLDPQPPESVTLSASDDPVPVDLDDDGLPVHGTDPDAAPPVTTFGASSNAIRHTDVARYAYNHAYDKPPRVFKNDDCTDFASKALHYGGLPFRNGYYRNNKHWWSNHLNRTFSWGAVVNLSAHLGYRNVQWVRYTRDAMPGDILFWKYREWRTIGHTSVITATSGWDVWYSQHSGPRRNYYLQKQLSELNAQGHGPVSIYIARLDSK